MLANRLHELNSEELLAILNVHIADTMAGKTAENENEPPAEENVAPEQLRIFREFIDLE